MGALPSRVSRRGSVIGSVGRHPAGSAAAGAQARAEVLVGRIAIGLIVLQTTVRGWICLRGYFYLDDFAFIGRATDHPLWSVDYLGLAYNNHVMPGAYVWASVTTRLWPLDFWPVAGGMLALQLALAVLTYRLLVELFGRRPGILVPLAVALFSPVSLPASLWWAAAVNQLPQQLATVGALLVLVRYFRTGRVRHVLLGPAVLVGGLLFSEKTLLLLPLLAGVTLAFFTTGPLWRRVLQTLRRDRWVWTGHGVVAAGYLAYYVLEVPSPLHPVAAGHDVADLVVESVFRGALPGLLGGPWQWAPIGAAGGLADPDPFLAVASFLVVTAVVAGSVVIWRGASRAWLVVVGYAAVNLYLLARSRATFVGPLVGTEYRYQTDVALVAAIGLAFATLRTVGAFPFADADPLEPRTTTRAWLRAHVLEPMRAAGAAPTTTDGLLWATAATSTGLLVASSLLSTARYDPLWVANPARPYVDTVRSQLPDLPPGTVLGDVPVPDEVAWPLLAPYNRTYRMFGPLLTDAQVLAPGESTAAMVVPDRAGVLHPALVAGPTAAPGPTRDCGWLLGQGRVTIPLRATATDAVAVVRVAYTADRATMVTLGSGDHRAEADLRPGAGTVFAAVPGPVSSLVVVPSGDGARVCTDDIGVGVPVPAPGGTP